MPHSAHTDPQLLRLNSEAKIAKALVNSLPVPALNVIMDENWKGGPLVHVSSEISRPTSGDVAKNYHILKPIVMGCPDRASQLTCLFSFKRNANSKTKKYI